MAQGAGEARIIVFSYSHVSTLRAREAAVQGSENSVYKMHEKDSEDSVYKMHEKNSETSEGGRWKMEGGLGRYRRFLGEFPHREVELAGVDEPTLLEGCTLLRLGTGALRPTVTEKL